MNIYTGSKSVFPGITADDLKTIDQYQWLKYNIWVNTDQMHDNNLSEKSSDYKPILMKNRFFFMPVNQISCLHGLNELTNCLLSYQMFIEHLLQNRSYAKCWEYRVPKKGTIPSFVDLMV